MVLEVRAAPESGVKVIMAVSCRWPNVQSSAQPQDINTANAKGSLQKIKPSTPLQWNGSLTGVQAPNAEGLHVSHISRIGKYATWRTRLGGQVNCPWA